MNKFLAPILGAFLLAACTEAEVKHKFDHARRSANVEDARDTTLYGDQVMVRAYRGMGGQLTDHATWNFAYDAKKLCGVRFYVESGQQTDKAAFRPGSLTQRARFVVFVGTSLGGYKAREHAEAFGKPVRLLLVDTVPWTKPIPKNVGADHVVWRNTLALYGAALGGGRPQGTINDKQHDRPDFTTHGLMIHRQQTRKEVAAEICRGITHPNKRPK
jgi:hypothetical protein